jgi:sugar phosphate isomerase/epimerase
MNSKHNHQESGSIKLTMSGEALSYALSLDKALEFTRSQDIRYFELWAQNCEHLSGKIHPRLYRNRDITKTKKQLSAAGVSVACVAFGGAFHQEIVDDQALYSQELIRAIEIAADLGAGLVNHYVNLISPQFEIDFSILDCYFLEALRRAEQLGIVMVLENEAHDITHTPDKVMQIINHFNSGHFRSNFDATNFYQAGIEAFPNAYEFLKDVIRYVHIKNGCIYEPEAGHRDVWKGGKMSGYLSDQWIYYTLPDQGAVNIVGLINKLKSDNYDGFLTLEPHSNLENVISYYVTAIPLMRELGIA